MDLYRPRIGITMGDPVGIGPEVVLRALHHPAVYQHCRPLVFGDLEILKQLSRKINLTFEYYSISDPKDGVYEKGGIDIIPLTDLHPEGLPRGAPSARSGKASITYIQAATNMALERKIDGIVTGPIHKVALKLAGSRFSGHTEMLAHATGATDFRMMMAGNRLCVVLVTIHLALRDAIGALTAARIVKTIQLAADSLQSRFGIASPRIAVAGLNPHAGEQGLFGTEEIDVIQPAVTTAVNRGLDVSGPFPPDTVFYQAVQGQFDAVVCMYHDQGLIPFKLMHFTDGVNTTLGLPIIRTSVDHGTAYEIAGTGQADPGSMLAAIEMATLHATNVREG